MKRTGHPTYHNKTGQLVIALGYVLGAAACDVGTTPANAATFASSSPDAAIVTPSATPASTSQMSAAGSGEPARGMVATPSVAGASARPAMPEASSAARPDIASAAGSSAPAVIDVPSPSVPNVPAAMSGQATADCLDCGDYTCDGTPLRFLAHGKAAPEDQSPFDATNVGGAAAPDLYQCFFFAAPWQAGAQATGFRPVLDQAQIVHHWLLYASPDAPPDVVEGGMRANCAVQGDANRVLLASWFPGNPGRNLPADVGQDLPVGPRTFLTLEVHYYNSNPGAPILDRTGAEICLAKAPRAQTATQYWLGTEKISVPAGQRADASDTCTPTLGADKTATILSITPHMHLTGKHAKVEIMRAEGKVELLHDQGFDFQNQATYHFDPPVVLHQGDRVRTTCTFENQGQMALAWGEGSQEKMCYLYTNVYPADALRNGRNGCTADLCLPGGVNRCIDNENILDGIGGL